MTIPEAWPPGCSRRVTRPSCPAGPVVRRIPPRSAGTGPHLRRHPPSSSERSARKRRSPQGSGRNPRWTRSDGSRRRWPWPARVPDRGGGRPAGGGRDPGVRVAWPKPDLRDLERCDGALDLRRYARSRTAFLPTRPLAGWPLSRSGSAYRDQLPTRSEIRSRVSAYTQRPSFGVIAGQRSFSSDAPT
jgi:hypothetical protein